MFKVGRWRHEKIKVVFKLQFQVSQVPCSKSKLMLSVVPVDVGQPTVRLGKAAVQDGICTWENPVYEKGSSKAGFLGEVLVNLADYVDATAPYTISLPIKSSNAGAILHVSIQNMQGADYQREPQMEIEENRTSITHEGSLQSQDSNFRSEGDVNCYSHEDEYNTMSPLNNEGKKNIKNGNTLNSFFEQKQSRSHQETNSDQSPNQNKPVPKPIIPSDKERPARKPLVLDWSSDEDYITNYAEETNNIREQEQEPPKSLVEQLEREIFALKRQAEVTDIELQSLRRQVVKETKRAQDFSEQVVRLKEERNAFRRESDKTMLKQDGENGNERPKETGTESKKSRHRKNEVEEDLVHAKDFNKALRSQLRKTQDSNSELILVVRDLEEKLGKKEKELDDLTRKLKSEKKSDELQDMNTEHELFSDTELEDEQSPKENPTEVILLQQQIKSLQGEVEVHLKENRKLQERIKQFSQDSELGKKENDDLSSKFNQKQLELIKKERECAQNARKVEELESQIARLEKVIKQQAEEFGDSSDTIRDLETQVNSLKYELEKQAAEYEDEFKVMTNAKVELEQKALQAEESLRKTKLDNASAAQRLQDEFRELSDELEAKFKENEELTEKAETEARELRLYINTLEEQLGKVTKELESVQDRCTTEVEKLSTQLEVKENQQKQLLLAHKDELMELKSNKKRVEDKCQALSTENQALRMEVERLTEENYYFTKKEEEMERLVDETNKSVQETKRDKEELETKFSLATIEIKQAQEELKSLRPMKEKEDSMAAVQSELEKLQVQHHELNNRLSEIKLENENLRKQLIKHKENLHKKDHEIANLEKIKDSSSKEVSTLKEKVKQLKAVRPSGISPDNGCKDERKNMVKKSQLSATSSKSLQNGGSRAPGESRKEFTEKKVTNSQTNDLLSEVALLKEKNKTMGDELKEMQEKYSEVSLKFAEVEGERQQLVMTIRNLRNGQKK